MADATNMRPEERQDLAGLFSRLRRHLPIILACVIVAVVLAWAVSKVLPRKYTASAQLEYTPQDAVAGTPPPALSDLARDAKIDAEVQTMKSLPVAVRVVEQLRLDRDPELRAAAQNFATDAATEKQAIGGALLANLSAARVGTTSLFEVRYIDKNPLKAMQVANAFAQAFMAEDMQTKVQQYRDVDQRLGGQLEDLRRKVEQADAQVAAFRVRNNLLGLPDSVTAEQEISGIRNALATARAEEAAARARSAASGTTIVGGGGASQISTQTLSTLRQQRAQVAARVASLQSRYGERYPALADARKELDAIDAQLSREMRDLSRSAGNVTQAAGSTTASLEASLAAAQARLANNVRASVELADLQRTAQNARDAYQQLLTTSTQQNAQQSIMRPDSRLAAPATLPLTPSSPNVPVLLFMGAVLGLAIGLAIAYIRERWVQGLDTVDDIETMLGVDYFNSVPTPASAIEKPRTSDPAEAALLHPLSAYTEAYRNLATSLSFTATSAQGGKILGITSALPKEGKTTTSTSVARVLATGGSRTLLLDTDLRRRSVSVALAPQARVGLGEVLAGSASIDDVVLREEATGLDVLPLAPTIGTSSHMFETPEFAALLAELRGRYEHIVVDTAPVLAVADTRVLAHHFDALALLVRWRSTPARAARAALHQITSVGAGVTGVALTMVNLKVQAQSGFGDPSYYADYMKDYYAKS
ncbi:capsular exopolysaccharide synthesis family protein [Sphingomonas sp. BE138]|uniref:GumC family protein n=1 Tax=Sphingomonas sp. BE138 TaxID=2817845 RepID=UPI00285D2BAF|nr:polysaccharide biosynthesis tyrosine autokinase [Sphingomonas sp. BE138]MDR6788486.1 capsular exopolysaccharide synthesis family protein [Sphingomonas sp. BE138]